MKTEKILKWTTTEADAILIHTIATRAQPLLEKITRGKLPRGHVEMDLTAVHLNGCPLDLKRLALAPQADLLHDVAGIYRHLDRETGELGGCFLPRFARKEGR